MLTWLGTTPHIPLIPSPKQGTAIHPSLERRGLSGPASVSTDEVSTVYRAQDTQFGKRVVALKEIGQNNPDAQELIEASRREMLTLASLIHPHLPRIYDYFVEDQRWYFVMDFLEG